jgi:hypothetical protein
MLRATEGGPAAQNAAGEARPLPGCAVLRASADAKYELGRPIRLQLATSGSEKTTVQVIKLSAARVSVSMPEAKQPKTAVLIQAPRKVSAVAKGGESTLIVDAERITVAALRGEMLVALGKAIQATPTARRCRLRRATVRGPCASRSATTSATR